MKFVYLFKVVGKGGLRLNQRLGSKENNKIINK